MTGKHSPGLERRVIIAAGLLAVAAGVFAYLLASGRLWPLLDRLWEVFRSKDELRLYVESWGNLAPVAFIAIQAFQVVLAPIPGELTGAVGGFIFGGPATVLYSSIGLVAGSVVAFWAGRIIGQPIVELFADERTLKKMTFLSETRGFMAVLVLFIIPGFPKDILSYLLGLSPMGFLPFLLACALGRLPGTILLSFSGSAVYDENWSLLAGMSAICAIMLGLFLLYRRRIDEWLRKRGATGPPADGGPQP